jgi:hypothetical protein
MIARGCRLTGPSSTFGMLVGLGSTASYDAAGPRVSGTSVVVSGCISGAR